VSELVDAEQVYNCLWSHAGGAPGHIHYVVQPVTADQVRGHGARGPALQAAMFAEGLELDPTAVEHVAARAREGFRLRRQGEGLSG
jgi:hypothetical protein